MNFLAAGFSELLRKFHRAQLRVILLQTGKKLRAAEIELGWLGWQGTDFFDPEMLKQIEKIEQFEKEQAQLVNVSAESAAIARDLEVQRVSARETLAQKLAEIEQQRAPLEKNLATLEPLFAEKRRALERFTSALAELAELPNVLTRRYAELMAIETHTPEIRAELVRISDERRRIPAEKEAMLKNQFLIAQEVRQSEATVSKIRAQVSEQAEAERSARKEFQETDSDLAARIRDHTREAKHSDKHMESLDAKKAEPFLIIGRCLADHRIPPMNQPEALERVIALRSKIDTATQDLEQSRSESAAANSWSFYALLGLVLLLGVALVALLWR